MPLLTPSRIVVLVVSLSLFTFMWTWGTPSVTPTPSFPHDGPHKPEHEIDTKRPDVQVPGAEASQVPGGNAQDKEEEGAVTSLLESLVTTPTPLPSSTPTPTPTPKPTPSQALEETAKSSETEEKVDNASGDKTEGLEQETSTGTVVAQKETVKSEETTSQSQTTTEKQTAAKAKGTQETSVPEASQEQQETAKHKDHKSEEATEASATEIVKATATDVDKASVGTTLKTEVKSSTTAKPKPTPQKSEPVHNKFCNKVKGAPQVMIIIKTSKGEIEQKLPAHLKTLLTCAPNFAIFSDHSGEIDGVPVHDVLEGISKATKSKHDEFKDYEQLQTQQVQAGSVNKELDKWKFLPMVLKAYQMKPESRFFLFIEADTSLSWTNVLQWIDRLDYRIPYYSGAPTYMGDVKFAQRGSGILLSQGAMRLYAKAHSERGKKWEERVGRECCGDMVLATAMADSHVEFYSAFPLLQGETPTTLDWTDRHWCAPMVSWHHMGADNIKMVWQAEQNWTSTNGWAEPYLYRDAFAEFIEAQLTAKKTDWDNISADSKIIKPAGANEEDPSSEWAKFSEQLRNSVRSPEDCAKVCELADDCLQWKHSTGGGGECYSGKVIRLGHRKPKKDGQPQWTSGWMVDRIKKTTQEWACEKGPKWKFNQ